VTNSALAQGTPPGSTTPVSSPPSDATVTVPQSPSLTVAKSADLQTITAAGQTITYSFAITNTGNVTLSGIAVTEKDFSGSGALSAIDCPTTTLAPGTGVTCTATYTVTQKDVDSGSVTNAALATGTPPGDNPPVDSPPSGVDIPVTQSASIALVKSVDASGMGDFAAGSTVTYSFVATNTGNTTLANVSIEETAFSGTGTLSAIDCPADQTELLAPGAQVICTATYTLTQADVDAGEVTNSAVAHGTPPESVPGGPVTSLPSDAVIPTPPNAALSLVKSADVQKISTVGQTVTFTFVVTNTGNVTITDPTIDETAFSGTGTLSAIDCPDGPITLIPGQSVTCTATYQVTQADLDSGALKNTATATGTTPGGDPTDPSTPSTVTVPTDAQPALTLVKKADQNTVTGVGQTITYRFTVTNTGNVTLRNVTVQEKEFTGTGTLSAIDCPAGIRSIAPGVSVICSATYVTTAADVKAGRVSNAAVAAGDPATGGDPVPSGPSSFVVSIQPGGILAFTGSTVLWPVAIGAIALIGGGAATLLIRRRRQA
jgi:uncharacterized repeat protein (TIGR01451 family)